MNNNYNQCESYEKRLLNFMIYVNNNEMPNTNSNLLLCYIGDND